MLTFHCGNGPGITLGQAPMNPHASSPDKTDCSTMAITWARRQCNLHDDALHATHNRLKLVHDQITLAASMSVQCACASERGHGRGPTAGATTTHDALVFNGKVDANGAGDGADLGFRCILAHETLLASCG